MAYRPVQSFQLTERTSSPRMCHLKKKSAHNEYGFYFYQENGKHIIGIVDEGGIADKAGLREGDSIVEVDDTDVTNASHKVVVAKIKSIPLETKILVVNLQGVKYHENADRLNVHDSMTESMTDSMLI